MPLPQSQEEIEAVNLSHARKIKRQMTNFLATDPEPQLLRPPQNQEDEDYEDRGARGIRVRDRVGDMLQMPDGQERKMIPMKDIMDSADAQHNAVLKKPWYVTENSNRDRVLAKFILDNVDELIKEVPVRCKDFDLLPEQRVAIMAMTNPMPIETYTQVEITHDAMKQITRSGARKQPFKVKYNIESGALPVFTIADYCTGSGKTIMAIMAALSLLCCRERWTQLRTDYKDILRSRIRETHSGLCKGGSLDSAKLARLAVLFVPATMLSHWYKTAQSAIFGVKEVFGFHTDVVVWKGDVNHHSVREAYDSGKPTLWVLPMEAESMKAVRQHPDIGYAVRIFDELNMTMRTRYDQLESTPCFNYITQATIESLEKSTIAQPRHPLRMAFGENYLPMYKVARELQNGNYKYVQFALEHFCKMRQFAAPEFLRRLVADGVQQNMPSGLIVQKLNLRAGTLAAVATGSDMVTISLPDLVCQLLGTNVQLTVKEDIRRFISDAETVGQKELLDGLAEYIEKLPIFTMHDHSTKQSVIRLKDRLADILGGKLPECPITMEEIPKERVRILKCCTCVIDSDVIEQCKGRCPLCRAAIKEVGSFAKKEEKEEEEEEAGPSNEGVDGADGADGKRKVEGGRGSPSLKKKRKKSKGDSEFEDSDSDAEEEASDDEEPPEPVMPEVPEESLQEQFEQKISEISGQRPYSIDGIMAVLNAQVEMNPASRVLLCFGFERGQTRVVDRIASRIRHEIQGSIVTDIDKCARDYVRMETAKMKFDDTNRYPTPNVFILNTTDKSKSVQGLDLHMTDLTIVADQCSLPSQRQAAGRSLRMKKRPREMRPEDRFPPKRLVVAAIDGFA